MLMDRREGNQVSGPIIRMASLSVAVVPFHGRSALLRYIHSGDTETGLKGHYGYGKEVPIPR